MSCELVILFYVYSCLENFLHALFLLHIVTLGAAEWSQVFSSSFCGLHSSASQRLLCEMLSFQYDKTQTGLTS